MVVQIGRTGEIWIDVDPVQSRIPRSVDREFYSPARGHGGKGAHVAVVVDHMELAVGCAETEALAAEVDGRADRPLCRGNAQTRPQTETRTRRLSPIESRN